VGGLLPGPPFFPQGALTALAGLAVLAVLASLCIRRPRTTRGALGSQRVARACSVGLAAYSLQLAASALSASHVSRRRP
jgi:hypothetical protein